MAISIRFYQICKTTIKKVTVLLQKKREEEKRMKQIVKRILTFALSAAMVLTLVPTTAFAEDTGSNKVNKNLRVSGTSDAVTEEK